MEELLCQAIENRKLISFAYDGYYREVEPFTLGVHKDTDNLSLSAWWVGGHSHSRSYPHWRLYTVDLMSDITILNRSASSYQDGYNPNDKRMRRIICTA